MNELSRALGDIRSIRRQVAEATEFRGYGPATLFGTSVLALLGGAAQLRWISDPAVHRVEYVVLWLSVAVLSASLIAAEMLLRVNRLHVGMADEMIRMAVVQFLPAAVAGAILPLVLLRVTSTVFWVLPGLWHIIFGLGVFASYRCLPSSMRLAGVWFLAVGFAWLLIGNSHALSPASMTLGYTPGMALVALLQHRSARKALSLEEDR